MEMLLSGAGSRVNGTFSALPPSMVLSGKLEYLAACNFMANLRQGHHSRYYINLRPCRQGYLCEEKAVA